MNTQLNALIIEDDKNDLFLLVKHLGQHWTKVNYEAADTLDGVMQALKSKWDIIICDFHLPTLDGLTVLRIINEQGIKTPFILLSGQVHEDIAAAMLRLGAADYVMKDNLKRLVPAILREAPYTATEVQPTGAASVTETKSAGAPESQTAEPKDLNKLLNLFYAKDPLTTGIKILERHKAVVNIMYIANLIRIYQHKILEQYNLSEPQLNVLRFLKRIHPEASSMSMIKENSINKTADTSRIIQRMASEGLIIYQVSSNDKRVRDILISEKGLNAISEVDKVSDQMFLPENYLSEEDAKKINEALAKTLRMLE